MLVSIYVFESVFGNDLVNIIKEFILSNEFYYRLRINEI